MTPDQLLIATALDGHPETATVHFSYMTARERLIRGGADTIGPTLGFSDDLSRARSRVVHHALKRPGWSWMLWWDEDNAPEDHKLVPRMLKCAIENGHGMLCAPYPRKRMPKSFVIRPLPGATPQGDVLEVACCGFGFVLTSRAILEKMTDRYAEEWFTDFVEAPPPYEKIVALFKQVHTGCPSDETRELLSEDHSFCWRWRAMGGKVHCYVGPGAPVLHIGGFVYGSNSPTWTGA